MNQFSATLLTGGLALLLWGGGAEQLHQATDPTQLASGHAEVVGLYSEPMNDETIQAYCVRCHNERMLRGNLSLEDFRMSTSHEEGETTEKMIRKLRAGMMPPPGARRPAEDTLLILVQSLESSMDMAAARDPNPGGRTFQRLNRAEYQSSIEDLLGLSVDAGDYLPLDTKSANFDNIADVQMVSPTLLDAYLHAAAEISRLAVGDAEATASETQYRIPRWASQLDRVDGAPFGTRGGTATEHHFPADGEYVFRMSFHHETTGTAVGNGRSALHTAYTPEQIEVSVDGEPVALLEMDRWMHVSDPASVEIRTEPIFIRAGSHRVAAAFIRHAEGPVQDLVSPHDWSLASTAIAGTYGVNSLPHMRDLVISGPFNITGVSETVTRAQVFTCQPSTALEEQACAEKILFGLGTRAFRRPLTDGDRTALMLFYEQGASDGGFEIGVRTALEAILASPHFVFRFEEPPGPVTAGESYRISDLDLASRLSYFLWGAPPDGELRTLAEEERLSDPETLEAQVYRMLSDSRSAALGPRFAAQWLRLQDLDKVHPDVRLDPDFHQQLADAMRRETELLFNNLIAEDRSIFDLYEADYTFVNERLAKHYGFSGVTGEEFQRVTYPDDTRRGVFGHGSILTLTSHAGRTSPVLRGKWVMEVLLGTPPPPPPPGIPDLEETEGSEEGRLLTTRERMALHSENPSCNSCHRFMDPIGLVLDNFGVSGKWRARENGTALDTRSELYDGTPIETAADLTRALLNRPIPLVRNFTENLMAYALGRRLEYYDQPTVRDITNQAEVNDYRLSSFIVGIVKSDAFQMQRAGVSVEIPLNEQEIH